MDDYTVADHFAGKDPDVQRIYDRLLAELRTFGPVHEAPKKTSIHLDNHHGFAGVYARKSYINLQFRLADRVENPRISKIEQHSARRFMHTVKLVDEADVDAELIGWLKEAYDLSAG